MPICSIADCCFICLYHYILYFPLQRSTGSPERYILVNEVWPVCSEFRMSVAFMRICVALFGLFLISSVVQYWLSVLFSFAYLQVVCLVVGDFVVYCFFESWKMSFEYCIA